MTRNNFVISNECFWLCWFIFCKYLWFRTRCLWISSTVSSKNSFSTYVRWWKHFLGLFMFLVFIKILGRIRGNIIARLINWINSKCTCTWCSFRFNLWVSPPKDHHLFKFPSCRRIIKATISKGSCVRKHIKKYDKKYFLAYFFIIQNVNWM